MKYKFYGNENGEVFPVCKEFLKVKNQFDLYELLSEIWCEYTCAPRLRAKWNKSNKTVGQCSITAFLVQDIFGGEVYGVLLNDGAFHCYNIVGGVKFDLTSEQFSYALEYKDVYPQSREKHFSSKEKYERYNYLKAELLKVLGKR